MSGDTVPISGDGFRIGLGMCSRKRTCHSVLGRSTGISESDRKIVRILVEFEN